MAIRHLSRTDVDCEYSFTMSNDTIGSIVRIIKLYRNVFLDKINLRVCRSWKS